MEEYKDILIENSIEKCYRAIKSAENAAENNDYETALNRIYYAIFYSVIALGYKYNNVTSKHYKLLGWFNKKFIHEDKIFPPDLYQIYKIAFDNRQESDYGLWNYDAYDKSEVVVSLNKAKYFCDMVINHLKD